MSWTFAPHHSKQSYTNGDDERHEHESKASSIVVSHQKWIQIELMGEWNWCGLWMLGEMLKWKTRNMRNIRDRWCWLIIIFLHFMLVGCRETNVQHTHHATTVRNRKRTPGVTSTSNGLSLPYNLLVHSIKISTRHRRKSEGRNSTSNLSCSASTYEMCEGSKTDDAKTFTFLGSLPRFLAFKRLRERSENTSKSSENFCIFHWVGEDVH